LIGEVVDWFSDQHYGRLLGADGRRYFVHVSALRGTRELSLRTRVEFRAVDSDRGPRAEHVCLLGAPAPVELPTSGES